MGRECENVRKAHTSVSCSHKAEHFFYESRRVLPRRTPVVFHSLSSLWKKENEPRERRHRQIEIFLCSGVPGCSALPMLTSPRTRNFISTNDTAYARLQDASDHPSTCRSFGSRHRRILHRRASLRQTLRLNKKSNRKQRPINNRRPPSTRAALWGADLCARND